MFTSKDLFREILRETLTPGPCILAYDTEWIDTSSSSLSVDTYEASTQTPDLPSSCQFCVNIVEPLVQIHSFRTSSTQLNDSYELIPVVRSTQTFKSGGFMLHTAQQTLATGLIYAAEIFTDSLVSAQGCCKATQTLSTGKVLTLQ